MSREYLIKGLEDEDVKHYFNFMQKVGRFFLAEWDQGIHFLNSQRLSVPGNSRDTCVRADKTFPH